MRKIVFLTVLLLFVSSICFAAFGDDYGKGINIKTYVSDNTLSYGIITNVSTTDFPLTNRILGVEVVPLPPSGLTAGLYGVIFDATSGMGANATMIAEVIPPSTGYDGVWFPYPKLLINGLTISQGQYTCVIIYYVTE